MFIRETSGEFINSFISTFKKNKLNIKNKQYSKEYNKIIKTLYNDIYKAHLNPRKTSCVKSVITPINKNKEAIKPEIYNSRFFPAYIKKYINEQEKYQLMYKCKVGGREICIYFTLFSEDNLLDLDKYTEYVKIMYMWLDICANYSLKHCVNTLDIYVYQTPFLKKMPSSITTTLDVEHVNTAFTMSCNPTGEIVIYRDEEWFKVFIHETFHAYGLDFASMNVSKLHKTLKELFPIDSDFNVTEAYAETWARIINGAFCSFNSLENKDDYSLFNDYMDFCLQFERIFSLYQCNKLLKFMGLTYEDLHGEEEKHAYLRKNLYRENTNVFSYYILTAIFLNDYTGFLQWCNTHNTSLLQFNSSDTNMNAFGEYIQNNYNNKLFINGINEINKLYNTFGKSKTNNYKKILSTTRMSIIEFI
jgi:hypothetical protein